MIPIEQWPPRLEELVQRECSLVRRVTMLNQTDSTQDAARRMGARPGDVVAAWRQTAGRGRLGRSWLDTVEDGLAVTIALEPGQAERLAIAAAVAVATAIEALLSRRVSIKWPNDIELDKRKVAGILIEQNDAAALLGIGVNVSQTHWPAHLANRAVSLKQVGCSVDRLEVLLKLLPALEKSLGFNDLELNKEFAWRDALCGGRAAFRCSGRIVSGIVRTIDPCKGLLVAAEDGEIWLPAATTSLIDRE